MNHSRQGSKSSCGRKTETNLGNVEIKTGGYPSRGDKEVLFQPPDVTAVARRSPAVRSCFTTVTLQLSSQSRNEGQGSVIRRSGGDSILGSHFFSDLHHCRMCEEMQQESSTKQGICIQLPWPRIFEFKILALVTRCKRLGLELRSRASDRHF